ncbi:long-chain fatty acid--CoA ligase [Guptibacillus hwajinpoensis]|uniref:long-chain fatty acid--CoA ligase n=1 Tax=Guptibacillus hwajinpoensis TaxID=208199 RepID=UPI0024B3A6D0|nr:long-chain fatty acid--CoA ligase [Pseudalkalibacillus hwajinpoensis]
MQTNHFKFWPKRVPYSLTVPETTIYDNLAVSAKRYPNKEAIIYYGATLTYKELLAEVDRTAAFLEQLKVTEGENVLLFMQNSAQFVISYYAILRANAVVVPINPMLTAEELSFYIKDCDIKTAIVGQELYEKVEPLVGSTTLTNVITAAYSHYAGNESDIPAEVSLEARRVDKANHYTWEDVVNHQYSPGEYVRSIHDVAVMPYTSGTTGLPKGCIHPNRTLQANAVGASQWMNITADGMHLVTLPLFHVTGMLHSMHAPIYSGAPMVVMTRWDRDLAAKYIEKYEVANWVNISTMLIDFLSNPNLPNYSISSLKILAGGGAPLPAAVGEKLYNLTGLRFIEGYGLSETISHTHFNPPDFPKLQCLGVPSFDVDARVIDPNTMKELGPGEPGEIVVNGPQVFDGYYNREDENRNSFIDLDGKSFFRTGDIGRYDKEGYFFMIDRVKRMVNASGFKVWPTEVESILYKHPAVQQACVVGVPDPRRGETVKAFVILNEGDKGKVTEEEIIEWSKEQMAAYKYPRMIEFMDAFPTTSSGKILWRKLQDNERQKAEGVK